MLRIFTGSVGVEPTKTSFKNQIPGENKEEITVVTVACRPHIIVPLLVPHRVYVADPAVYRVRPPLALLVLFLLPLLLLVALVSLLLFSLIPSRIQRISRPTRRGLTVPRIRRHCVRQVP